MRDCLQDKECANVLGGEFKCSDKANDERVEDQEHLSRSAHLGLGF